MDDTEQISKWIEWETKNKDYLYDKKVEKNLLLAGLWF